MLIPKTWSTSVSSSLKPKKPLNVFIRKVKILKAPKFDLGRLMEVHRDYSEDVGVKVESLLMSRLLKQPKLLVLNVTLLCCFLHAADRFQISRKWWRTLIAPYRAECVNALARLNQHRGYHEQHKNWKT